MTKTTFDALKMTIPGSQPFASGSNATATPPGATTGDFSMPDGFGSAFDAAPADDGSNMVQRGQMNYIGKMASYVPFLGQTGGSFWGFDPAVCTAISGYPKGAILTLVKDSCYLKVISLQDNNMVDFTGTTDTTTYSSVTNGSVDGVYWQYLSLDPQTLIDQSVICEIPDMIVERELTQVLNIFNSSNQAGLVVTGGLNITFERETVEEGVAPTYQYGLNLIISPAYASLDALKQAAWKPITVSSEGYSTINGTVIFNLGNISRETQAFVTEAGMYYAIGFYGFGYKDGGSEGAGFHPLPLTISSSTVKVQLKAI